MIFKKDLERLRGVIMEWVDGGLQQQKENIGVAIDKIANIYYEFYSIEGNNINVVINNIMKSLSDVFIYGDKILWESNDDKLVINVIYRFPDGKSNIKKIILERR